MASLHGVRALLALMGATLSASLCVLAQPAQAQELARMVDRLLDPAPPLGPAIDTLLDEPQGADGTLGSALAQLDFEGCLQGAGSDFFDGLGALRALHVRAVERRSLTRVWRTWDRKLADLSPDAYLLVTTWLDSPQRARRLFLCDDGLPPSWKSLSPDAYVVEAITWFDVEVAERERALHQGAPGDRELAVMELMELRSALVDRYLSTYPSTETYDAPLARMEERLALQWTVLVRPFHTGFTPKARTDDADAKQVRGYRVRSPFSGAIGIPDPRDTAARDRVVRSWRRQRAILDAELKLRQQALDELTELIRVEIDTASLDELVREASRLDAQLAQAVSDIERLEARVRYVSTGRPWVDGMLDNGHRRRAVRRLNRHTRQVQVQRDAVALLMTAAVERGAMPAGQQRVETSPLVASGAVSRDEPGPGNWLAGLPGKERATAPNQPDSEAGNTLEGSGWVERVYEGPLPLPSATWSEALVNAITARHPQLDSTDTRILLGLVRAAYTELGDRQAIEEAVQRSLESESGLRIRGEEATLSDLWVAGGGRSEQPIVTFVLTLLF